MRGLRWVGVLLVTGAGLWMAADWLGDFFASGDTVKVEEESAPGSGQGSAEANGTQQETQTAQPTRAEQPGAEETPADPEATWVIQGRTVKMPDQPLGDVAVQVTLRAGPGDDGEILQQATLTSDEQGEFQWPLRPPERPVLVKATSDQDGYLVYSDSKQVPKGEGPPTLEVRLLSWDCRIEGIVRNTEQVPLAGVEVRMSSQTIHTDQTGAYRLKATSQRQEARLTVTGEGYAQTRATVQVGEPGSVSRMDFELVESLVVTGRVVDEIGLPVQGATVRTFFLSQVAAETAADGTYRLDHLDPRRGDHHVYARKEGYVEAGTRVEGRPGTLELPDLVMKRGIRVEGAVLGDGGGPLEDAELYIGFSPSSYNRLDAISGVDGRFVFAHVPSGTQSLFVSHPDFAPHQQALHISEGTPIKTGVIIQMQRGMTVSGAAHFMDGSPAVGVWISARFQDEYTGQRTETDEEGRFQLEGLPPQAVQLEFYATGLVRQNVNVDPKQSHNIQVTLERAAKVAGRVVDGVTGEPIPEFTIRFVRADVQDNWVGGYSATWAREGHRFTDTDGYWDSGDENLKPGGVTGIEARADGYSPGRLGMVTASDDPNPEACLLRLYHGTQVAGHVRDAAGRAVAGAPLKIQAAAQSNRYFSDEPHESGRALTDDQGAFLFDQVSPGEAVILVQGTGRPMYVDGPFDVPVSGRIDRDVTLPVGTTLYGVLRDAAGIALAGETISLFASEVEAVSNYSDEARTDDNGEFLFEGLPDGLYQLSHSAREGDLSAHFFTRFARVQGEATKPVVLQATGAGILRGRIIAASGITVPPLLAVSALYRATPENGREHAPPNVGTFARNGSFEIAGLEPGEYLLSVMVFNNSERLMGAANVEVGTGVVEVDVELKEMRIR